MGGCGGDVTMGKPGSGGDWTKRVTGECCARVLEGSLFQQSHEVIHGVRCVYTP